VAGAEVEERVMGRSASFSHAQGQLASPFQGGMAAASAGAGAFTAGQQFGGNIGNTAAHNNVFYSNTCNSSSMNLAQVLQQNANQ